MLGPGRAVANSANAAAVHRWRRPTKPSLSTIVVHSYRGADSSRNLSSGHIGIVRWPSVRLP